jgi:hypothetical protein
MRTFVRAASALVPIPADTLLAFVSRKTNAAAMAAHIPPSNSLSLAACVCRIAIVEEYAMTQAKPVLIEYTTSHAESFPRRLIDFPNLA